MRVRFSGAGGTTIRGAVTGKTYAFDHVGAGELMDPRDAVMAVRDSRFRIVGIVRLSGRTPSAQPPKE